MAQQQSMAIDEGFAISSAQLPEMEAAALDGDSSAAFRLSLHFSSGGAASEQSAKFWRLIAAENGNPVAQYNIWFLTRGSSDPLERKRAIFWLRRSADSGFADAQRELKEVSQRAPKD